jgi:hypothetical protein
MIGAIDDAYFSQSLTHAFSGDLIWFAGAYVQGESGQEFFSSVNSFPLRS